jgi:hypothetical protein
MNTDNNSIKKEDFTNNVFALLKETFEGSPPKGSHYLDREVGVLNTIEKISAENASRSIGGATIAAHLEHARFYLAMLPEFMNGRTEKVNWDESWLVKTVDEAQWNLLKENVRRNYEKVAEMFQTITDWDDEKVGGAMSIVVHTAYHLGAMRQIMKSY